MPLTRALFTRRFARPPCTAMNTCSIPRGDTCPALIIMPYLTATCNVSYNLKLTYLRSLRIWLRKKLSYQIVGYFLSIFGLQWCIHHIPQVTTLTTFLYMYKIYSWEMVIYDRKITAIILYIGSTLGNIYSKQTIAYCIYVICIQCVGYTPLPQRPEGARTLTGKQICNFRPWTC